MASAHTDTVAAAREHSREAEYRALVEGCGVVDRSQRGKLALTGSQTKSFLQGQVTNDVEALTPGQGCYAAFLTPKGKMLGDLRILDASEELLLDTERVALQELFNMIRRFCIDGVSRQSGKVAALAQLTDGEPEKPLFS